MTVKETETENAEDDGGTSLRIVLGEAFPEAVPQIEEGIRLSCIFH